MNDQTDFHDAVANVLQREVPGFEALQDCQQLSAGASQETYCLTLQVAGNQQQLALRRAQPTAGEAAQVGGIGLEAEAELLQLAHRDGIPTPAVISVLQPPDQLGSGFLMEWLSGETLGQRIVAAPELDDVRPALARECGQILGRIHALDWQGADVASTLPVVRPEELIAQTYEAYRVLNVPVPAIDYAWRWLRQEVPVNSRQTLVHGDFRNGNLMVTPTGINAVLDWELAHIGDPLRDLGWLCVNSWRFGKRDLAVGGFGDVADLIEGYTETSGVQIDAEALRFWQVFGSFWWAVITLQMANSWRTGETPSLERPVIGRRSSEAQMDCINLLFPGEFTLPEASTVASEGTQLPLPEELLDGVIDFLRDKAGPQLPPHDHFLARVAANSLRNAQREFQFGAAAAAAEHSRLQALLDEQGSLDELRRSLARQLHEGLLLDTPGLQAHLRQTVALQLFIDQPRYSALDRS